jgi:hypothetical protein
VYKVKSEFFSAAAAPAAASTTTTAAARPRAASAAKVFTITAGKLKFYPKYFFEHKYK